MTATDPQLAAMPAERLAPAAAALASAYAEDISAGAAGHLPEPERAPAEEPANDLDDWTPEPEPRTGFDGSEDLYNFGERQYVGRLTTPEFRDRLARQERREAADIAAREAAAGGAGAVG